MPDRLHGPAAPRDASEAPGRGRARAFAAAVDGAQAGAGEGAAEDGV